MLSDRDYMKTEKTRKSGSFQLDSKFTAVKILIAINVLVYFFQAGNPELTRSLVIHPFFIKNHEYWRIVTSMFAHGSFFHLLFNMIVIWSFGQAIERVLGRRQFFYLYFFSGFVSCLVWLASNWYTMYPALGASGAICGMIAVVAITAPQTQIYFFFIPKAIPIRKFVIWYSLISIILYLLRVFDIADPVNWAHMAHVGGFLGGWLWLTFLCKSNPKSINISKWFSDFKSKQKRKDFTVYSSTTSSQEVDRILDKISKHGINSLTPTEKETLTSARNNLK
ncbi:MAG: rhomboid family intramembrane serine protease [Lentisphaeria bacterium]|nr:rhomboid family intramembrane serine protease [Lentisphaeria bacterium]